MAEIPSSTAARENRLLGAITQVTCLGDFISFFAVLKWLSDSGVSSYVGGYAVVIKSMAVAVGAYLTPLAISRLNTKRVILLTQLLSGVCGIGLIALFMAGGRGLGHAQIGLIFGLLFFQTILKQVFDVTRETHSKLVSASAHSMSVQALLLANFYGAQFLGPILSFILVRWLPLIVPLAIDTLSFFGAAFIATWLTVSHLKIPEIHVLKPLRYLGKLPMLRDLFLLRSVVFWFSIGLFNYLLFSVITDRYGLSIIYSAFIYSAMGLGAAASSTILRGDSRLKPKWAAYNEGFLAFCAQLIFAIAIFGFYRLPSLEIALVVLTVLGLAMGVNTVATQTLRRKLTTESQFPEVVGLELIAGRVSDVTISSVAAASMVAGWASYENWLWVSAGVLMISAGLHLRFVRGSVRESLRI